MQSNGGDSSGLSDKSILRREVHWRRDNWQGRVSHEVQSAVFIWGETHRDLREATSTRFDGGKRDEKLRGR
jgi:hypothetical protein